jgi:DNA-binding CsgD family transcriptional regulator
MTGWFFAGVFFLGALMATLIAVGSLGKSPLEAFLHPYVFICLAISALMALSALVKPLVWLQPIVWLACATLSILTGALDITGLGFYVIGVILLFRFGFFERHRGVKLAATLGIFYALEIIEAFLQKGRLFDSLAAIFIITVLLVTIYLAFQEKLMVYLKAPKPRLSLSEKGLSEAEKAYVLALGKGLSPKEIAFQFEVSESTIRNTLARAYRKLDVTDRSGLAVLAANCDFAD